ncbi:MAG: Smr/MutS family protein [Psychroflexus sp.]|jgi:hypothetical protein|nr:Smr/MutS family protein [Psychroflexus sp.]MDR9448837.1 Smr/MutS family protein [Psychroflexus sp.]
MNLKIGDVVSVVDDTLEGKVHYINQQEVAIEDTDGFIYHFNINQVIKMPDQFPIKDHNLDHIIRQKESNSFSNRGHKKKRSKLIPEIDLHIHNLTHSTANMSDFDMLQLQLNTAEKRIKKAIENKEKRLVFIHGIGKGRLKKELMVVFSKFPEVTYYDADFQKYGRGATEIYIYENVI